ncbi:hypothetical protein HN587_04740 [Candidatus Woesearchaeota archaeon]|jgi:hypothetical protein|nr:hypothetical protein [Candidatus Woesearchaeota archaeon]
MLTKQLIKQASKSNQAKSDQTNSIQFPHYGSNQAKLANSSVDTAVDKEYIYVRFNELFRSSLVSKPGLTLEENLVSFFLLNHFSYSECKNLSNSARGLTDLICTDHLIDLTGKGDEISRLVKYILSNDQLNGESQHSKQSPYLLYSNSSHPHTSLFESLISLTFENITSIKCNLTNISDQLNSENKYDKYAKYAHNQSAFFLADWYLSELNDSNLIYWMDDCNSIYDLKSLLFVDRLLDQLSLQGVELNYEFSDKDAGYDVKSCSDLLSSLLESIQTRVNLFANATDYKSNYKSDHSAKSGVATLDKNGLNDSFGRKKNRPKNLASKKTLKKLDIKSRSDDRGAINDTDLEIFLTDSPTDPFFDISSLPDSYFYETNPDCSKKVISKLGQSRLFRDIKQLKHSPSKAALVGVTLFGLMFGGYSIIDHEINGAKNPSQLTNSVADGTNIQSKNAPTSALNNNFCYISIPNKLSNSEAVGWVDSKTNHLSSADIFYWMFSQNYKSNWRVLLPSYVWKPSVKSNPNFVCGRMDNHSSKHLYSNFYQVKKRFEKRKTSSK